MRILNRPMFRYGGPIKEGVMHGMRNNYQSGQLVQPGPGRPGYAGEDFWTKLAAQYTPKNLFKWSRFNPFSRKKLKAVTQGAKIIKGIPKNLQGVFTRTGTSPGITGTGAGSAWMAGPANILSKLKKVGPLYKKAWQKAPYTTLATHAWPAPYVVKGLYEGAKKIPWKELSPTKGWGSLKESIFGKDDDEGGDGTDTITEKIIRETGVPGGGDPEMTYTDPNKADALAKAAQNKRLKSYLDMMGYDSAKKTAMSDALIDASALVQDATTEAGSLKEADWSKLINRAIQTTSKRLDKPEQIREAVGLMMTKGAIEKDIAEAKGSPLDVKEKYLKGKLGEVAGERGALGKPTSLIEALNATKATDSKGNRTTQALMSYYDGHLVPEFKSKLSSKKIDDLGGEDIFKKDATIELGDGVYQVSNSYIIVQGKKIIELADVFGED